MVMGWVPGLLPIDALKMVTSHQVLGYAIPQDMASCSVGYDTVPFSFVLVLHPCSANVHEILQFSPSFGHIIVRTYQYIQM